MPEPPYGAIWNRLKRGEVIPFLGAGASLTGRPPKSEWVESSSPFLPTGRELARCLADEAEFPAPDPADRDDLAKVVSYYQQSADRDDLAKVASYYQESVDRAALVEFLREIFTRSCCITQYKPLK